MLRPHLFLFLVLSLCLSSLCLADTGRTWHVSQRPLPGIAADQQFTTISDAVKVVKPGDTVLIHTGIYREKVTLGKAQSGTSDHPITFAAALAAHVVITGADLMNHWTKVAGPNHIYSTPWSYVFLPDNPNHIHPEGDENLLTGRCEQVFVDGYALRQVLSLDRMERGSFYVDENAKLLYACSSDNARLPGEMVEASTRGIIWTNAGEKDKKNDTAEYVKMRGLNFRYAADPAQQGAVIVAAHNTVEDCTFEDMNAEGATMVGAGIVMRRCTFQNNGQLGWGCWGADHMLFTDCITRNNNTKNYGRGWEAGGDKMCFSVGAVIENSQFLDNKGNGIWFDIANHDCTVRNCLIANNEDAGIFYEISYGLHACDNVIIGNGLADTHGAWGASAGICLSSSPNCVIERNLLVGNKEGFDFREQDRTTPVPDYSKEIPVWNHDQIIRNNTLAYNRDAQTWGWFDSNDTAWPAADKAKLPSIVNGQPDANIAAAYIAKNGTRAPKPLEILNLNFNHNLYAVADNEEIFHWGVSWHRNKAYPTLDVVRQELKLEQGSVVTDFKFADFLTRDFRVPAHSLALKMGCYPKGEVPGVKLGVIKR
jgi:hypothetical protein